MYVNCTLYVLNVCKLYFVRLSNVCKLYSVHALYVSRVTIILNNNPRAWEQNNISHLPGTFKVFIHNSYFTLKQQLIYTIYKNIYLYIYKKCNIWHFIQLIRVYGLPQSCFLRTALSFYLENSRVNNTRFY